MGRLQLQFVHTNSLNGESRLLWIIDQILSFAYGMV